ncbi:alpha-1-antitrypsin [Phodopus roborovskii]|uniref:Serpina16 protein n=1 Tax=Phodopus roborovskii TaxID=109678 RepID=A0AAU9ZQV5_PHORO|nr:alpha-1-antitrypsin [Phodopus roborovskii]CAH6850303.1 Serpina16 [Phodopus roborovskii]
MAHSILSFWLLVAGLVPHTGGKPTPPTSLTQSIPRTPGIQRQPPLIFNNQKFALSLYRQLPVINENKNAILSPLSITVPLTLLAFQDKPEACHLVLKNLGFRVTKDLDTNAPMRYGNQLGALLQDEQCGIHTGSLLFMDKKLKPERKFLAQAQSAYNSDIILISLGDYELAHKQINSAMRDRTHGKIKRLLRDVKPLPNLVLANYIFFKGKWKYRFNPKLTEMKYFTMREGARIMVPMMQRVGWFRFQYLSHLHSYVLQMPYTCNISGVFILPEERRFEDCEKALLQESFDTWVKPLPLSRGQLFFPKFSILAALHLENFKYATSNLNLFYEHMDLSGITMPKAPLRVTTAVHRVELTMDEDGAEEENISDFQSIPKPLLHTLHFNRPFIVLILEEASHNLLFMGKVMNPTSIRSVPKDESRT